MTNADYLDGQLLIAMPGMGDPRFDHAVIYMCAHSPEGAMGLVVNKLADNITFPDLLEQLDIPVGDPREAIQVHFGGPVEESRGFVLHSNDYSQDGSMPVDEEMALTASVDVLKAISLGQGPKMSMLALGYAGWGPGQLDAEIQANAWLHLASNDELVFGADQASKWSQAVTMLGIDLSLLSTTAGHA
jgi:putative transcriptional regulator